MRLRVHGPALPPEEHVQAPVAVAYAGLPQLLQPQARRVLRRRLRDVALVARQKLMPRTPSLAHPVGGAQQRHHVAAAGGRHHFRRTTSSSIALSGVSTATICLSRRFSPSSCLSL